MTSGINIATAPRMTRDELAGSMLAAGELPGHTAIIDVRDDDYIGGHIRGSTNIPSSQLDWKLPELVRILKDKDTVVFHCALSQQRGPKAAMRYLQERLRFLETAPASQSEENVQKVCVLDGGFVRWQEKYGHDQNLTESYAADIWQDY